MKGKFNIDIEKMKKHLYQQGVEDRQWIFSQKTWTCYCGRVNNVGQDCRVCGQDQGDVPK